MFTPKQLEALEEILETQGLESVISVPPAMLAELRGAIQSAIWNSSRALSKADRARVAQAEKEGKVSVYERAQSSVPTTGGWTMASQIEARRAKLVSPVVQAGTGDDLLEALGL